MSTPSQILAAHQAAIVQVRSYTTDYAALLWKAQSGFRDADVANFTRRIVPVVQASQVRTASLTSSYMAQIEAAKGGAKVQPVPVVRADIVGGRGVDPVEVYTRPAATVRTGLSEGIQYKDAIGAGLARLNSIVNTDMQMAKVRQADSSMRRSKFQYYARVLTGSENCAMCTIASTQRYSRGNLMPIHPGCDCGVEPLPPGSTSGQVIDQGLLDRTHEQIASKLGASDPGARQLGQGKYVNYNTTGSDARGATRFGKNERLADYTDLIVSNNHGEYGPTLSWRGDHFTGPNAI